jgi:Uri superfamily endonuclease
MRRMCDPRVMNDVWWASGDALARVPAARGAYILEWRLESSLRVRFSRDREVGLGPGRVRYVGSAWGPGGLAARVGRHLRQRGRRDRWHVDTLTRVAYPHRVGWRVGGHECDIVRSLLEAGWLAPAAGFGASDCRRCPAHLVAETG